MNHEQYLQAVERLRAAAVSYYQSDGVGLLMSDSDYDHLMAQCAAYEKSEEIELFSVSNLIAAGAEQLAGDVEHSPRMLSLDNIFSISEFAAWAAGVERKLGREPKFTVEPKLDGLAVAIRYRNGVPVQMVTRGDGHFGEDVTFALPCITNLPHSAAAPSYSRGGISTRDLRPFTGEVRGEAIFTREQFEAANLLRLQHGDKPFVNARNGVAGALRGAGSRSYLISFSFFAYDAPSGLDAESHVARMARLESMRFETACMLNATFNGTTLQTPMSFDATNVALTIQASMPIDGENPMPVETDGLVIKVSSDADRDVLGEGSKAPYWAVAYKFPAAEVTSKLVDVHWQVGRTGVITPRAEIEPVFVGGTTVTYATLHNVSDIERKGFMVGDTVLVKRAGEVIPRLEAPLEALRDGTQTPILPPSSCPRCAGGLDKSQERWRCSKGRDCGVAEAIAYAASRDALDIDGLGKKQIEALVESGTFIDVASLFETGLSENLLVVGGGVAPANAPKIVAQIEKAKQAPFARVLTALGLRGSGRSASRAIARTYPSIEQVIAAGVNGIAEVVVTTNRIGVSKAEDIMADLQALIEDRVLERLAEAGVNLGPDVDLVPDSSTHVALPLAGKVVVVTGTMETRSRNEMNELVESLGGRASSSVSKSTDILVAGPGAGSKLAKAIELGVRTMTESEFLSEFGVM